MDLINEQICHICVPYHLTMRRLCVYVPTLFDAFCIRYFKANDRKIIFLMDPGFDDLDCVQNPGMSPIHETAKDFSV